jgi:hypothetical protein
MNIENTKMLNELAQSKFGNEYMYSSLWGAASALLTDEQAEIIKSVLKIGTK